MKLLEQEPDVMEIVKRWSHNEWVGKDSLQYAVERIRELTKPDNTLPEGQLIFLSQLAGMLNREIAERQTRQRLQAEGIPC